MYSDQDLAKRTEELVEENRNILDDQFAFRGAQYDAGLAMVHFPEGYGGLGGNRGQQLVSTKYCVPMVFITTIYALTPLVLAWVRQQF